LKKIRIVINKGTSGKKFFIFNSPESLYVWINDPELREALRIDPDLGSVVTLKPGETMEVEWVGCEFIDDGDNVIRIDQIRLAKTMKAKLLSSNKVIGIHAGWTTEDMISFKNGSDDIIKRTRLTNKSKHKFNIGEIFESRGLLEKDPTTHKDVN
jgi:hypothetical protein